MPAGLADVLRNAAADSEEFLIQQKGSGFGADLPGSNHAASGTNAEFSPNWSGLGSETLADAAYAVYRLTFDPAEAPVTLTLNWNGAAPADCWLAVSNWQRNAWDLVPLPTSSEVVLENPERYLDAQQRCYVAVLIFGQAAVSLAKIGYGEPPPPPPTGEGYTLFAPLYDRNTYLVDMGGIVVHSWRANLLPGATAKLMPNGNLMRAATLNNANFQGGGTGGRLTEFDWDGNVVWYYDLSTTTQCTHHDFEVLPNGNVLLIVWNAISKDDAIAAGRNPDYVGNNLWADSIVEVERAGAMGGNIVWEWKLMDHLVQDYDASKPNFGDPAQSPELVDLNYPPTMVADWTHINCVTYNAELDQIMLTTPHFNEIWVIDHSTSTEEAAGHSGGRYGRGGDLLYRWGNPAAYRAGGQGDQQLFFQHDAHWIPEGLDGAGQVLMFNNRYGEGFGFPGSAVFQIELPQNEDGSYYMDAMSYGPGGPSWYWVGNPMDSFFSSNLSAAQRLPGGGALVTSGASGKLFELNSAGEITWEYQNTLTSGNKAIFRAIRYPYDYPGVAALQQY